MMVMGGRRGRVSQWKSTVSKAVVVAGRVCCVGIKRY